MKSRTSYIALSLLSLLVGSCVLSAAGSVAAAQATQSSSDQDSSSAPRHVESASARSQSKKKLVQVHSGAAKANASLDDDNGPWGRQEARQRAEDLQLKRKMNICTGCK
jgi:hypothetical protein